eukprot:TRINITY_DN2446_c0_g1_i2.p1 TRINITY_DN2446_c0_g1~~TRINITY_DN2446_c0_g1_i2.p1  ORF type:complete len:297 (-),score=50.40 TRINITY_DN2446_c0_g1_i2:35-925(-)
MKLLLQSPMNIPTAFVTNGGGTPELLKAINLSEQLGINVSPNQVITSHTPFKDVVPSLDPDTTVLLVNNNATHSETIANNYGIKNFITIQDYAQRIPLLCPWKEYNCNNYTLDGSHIPIIGCVMILHEPLDWGESIQILVDVLSSNGRLHIDHYEETDDQLIPLFIANPDFHYSAKYENSRLTCNAFYTALDSIYHRKTGRNLSCTIFGKPNKEVYEYAIDLLNSLNQNSQPLDRIYCIGDNPKSDIQGANNAGSPFYSVLVKTGCFKGNGNDSTHPAKLVFDDVLEAVTYILQQT